MEYRANGGEAVFFLFHGIMADVLFRSGGDEYLLLVKEFAYAIHPGVASGSRRGLLLEAMSAQRKRVKFALDSHPAHLLPALNGVHGRPNIRIAVDEQRRTRIGIERELRNEARIVLVTALRIRPVDSVGERIGGIDRHRPLNVARKFVYRIVVPAVIASAARGRYAHKREVSASGGAHDAYAVRIKSL